MKDNKKEYTAPRLTVAAFKTEKGFALSNPIEMSLMFDNYGDNDYVEDYEVANGWTNGSNTFWTGN